MKNLMWAVAAATGLAMTAGQALAQDVNAAVGAAAAPSSACDTSAPGTASTAGTATISASSGSGGETHSAKVFACNGVRVGTATSTTTGPSGTVLTILPDANFLNGIASFQVSATGATTTSEGEIKLAMTDTALRESLASGGTGGSSIH